MSRRRVTVLLAIMAALAGAPSSVSAAHPNQLAQASVTPTVRRCLDPLRGDGSLSLASR